MNIEEIYKTIAPKLTNWLVSTGSSYHEACDLVQSTFLKIWKMRDDLHGDNTDVSGLAFTIARNLRKNLARDDARLTFVDEIKDEDGGSAGPAQSPSDAEYLRRRLSAAFAKLPPVLRDPRDSPPDGRVRKPREGAHLPRQAEAAGDTVRPPQRIEVRQKGEMKW